MKETANLYDLEEHIQKSFPMRESYTDCTGTEHEFVISVRSLPVGFVVEAREVSQSPYGYEFDESAEAHPFSALGRIRAKIRNALSRRYLMESRGEVCMATDELEGTIGDVGLIIDGKLVPWDDLHRMLTTCEGFPIKITVGR